MAMAQAVTRLQEQGPAMAMGLQSQSLAMVPRPREEVAKLAEALPRVSTPGPPKTKFDFQPAQRQNRPKSQHVRVLAKSAMPWRLRLQCLQ